MLYPQITIWGNSGSGKSSLAEHLGPQLGVPVFHIDLLAWLPEWQLREEAEFLRQHRSWLNRPTWLIEGVGCSSGMGERFQAADLIVYLQTPVEICHARATRRLAGDRTVKNKFMSEGCRYADVREKQHEIIDDFALRLRPAIVEKLETDFAAKAKLTLDGRKTPDQLALELFNYITAA